MRKLWIGLVVLILLLFAGASLVWIGRTDIVATMLSRHLGVPVHLRAFDLDSQGAYLTQLWVGNPPRFRTKTAFSAETLNIETTWGKLRSDPLIIEEISIRNILIGIENNASGGANTNWSYLLQSQPKNKMSDRDYLIKTLVLENLTVELTTADGKTKRFPTLARIELHNISSETGFPIGEIEKAILKQVMQDIIKQLNIKDILQGIQNLPGVPAPIKQLPLPFGS